MSSRHLDVLVCGAGPTGLMLALRLAHAGARGRFRIVDAVPEPGTTSRALVVHARTLEFYRQMGLAEAFLAEACPSRPSTCGSAAAAWPGAVLGDMGKGLSPFPFMVVCPQDRHERFLIEHLRRAGVEVERPLSLVDFTQDGAGRAGAARGRERKHRRSARRRTSPAATAPARRCGRRSASASPAGPTTASSTSPTSRPRAP